MKLSIIVVLIEIIVIRNAPYEDVFNLVALATASDFYKGSQAEIKALFFLSKGLGQISFIFVVLICMYWCHYL